MLKPIREHICFSLDGAQNENRNREIGLWTLPFFRPSHRNYIATFGQDTPGVSENEVLIGSCSALEGPSHYLGVETVSGAKAYFNLINEENSVHGRKLKLITADDSYDPAKTQTCFDHLMSEKVFALGFFVGTPTAVKYVPMAESAKIPIGLFTGAQTLCAPLRHWIVNVHAWYFDETREQIDACGKLSATRRLTSSTQKTHLEPPFWKASRRPSRSTGPNLPPSAPISLEGFADAMVLVEGLQGAGKGQTREGLIQAIESIHDHDLGLGPQLKLNYSPKEHKGFDHVIPTVVRGGRAVPFTDWSTTLSKITRETSWLASAGLPDGEPFSESNTKKEPKSAWLFVRGFRLLERVIRRTDQRAGFDVFEAHGFA
jgi:hypothetical protein